MPRKTIIIFITTFVIVGALILGVYYFINRKSSPTEDPSAPWYQGFNPFGSGTNTPDNNTGDPNDNTGDEPTGDETPTSKFSQITDFAIAGATFLEDTRPVVKVITTDTVRVEEVKIVISPSTKEGRKEIQAILNQTLSLNPPLVVDGNFGPKAVKAIKDFQALNNLTITGLIDEATAPYFTKTAKPSETQAEPLVEQAPSIRFAERMNGHIYKMFLDTKTKEKISNSTIPSIQEAFFGGKANSVVYRYVGVNKLISSFVATLGAPKGEFLPQNIIDLSVSKDGSKFFYLSKITSGSTGIIQTFNSSTKETVFTSPFTEWLSQWDNNGRIFLTTKPSYTANGSMFFLNTKTKTISKLFGNISGLTTMINPRGSLVLYSTSTDKGPKLSTFNLSEHSYKDLDTSGLPEKCVWSSDNINIYCAVPNTVVGNQYPDVWYQGLVSFDDYFVKINTSTGEKVTIANSLDETPIDGTYLFLNKSEDTLFFTNKKDSTLWSLDVR